SQGGGLLEWYYAGPSSYDTQFGTWGISEALDDLSSAKIQGIITVLSTPKDPLEGGIAIPAEWDARATAGSTQPYPNPYLKNAGKGATFDYIVRADKAGWYKLAVVGGTNGSNEQLHVQVNTTARVITLKNTGSLTSFTDNVF